MTEAEDVEQAEALGSVELDLRSLFERFERALLGGPRQYTRAEVSQAAGIEPDEARNLWRALGFGDVTALREAKFLAEHAAIDDEQRTAMTRMLGQTFSRLAAWQGQLLIGANNGRIVKTIGDEVLFVAPQGQLTGAG